MSTSFSSSISPSPSSAAAALPGSVEGQAKGLRSIISVRDMDFCYGSKKALHGIHLEIPAHQVTAFIGPSGCGKSTLLRCFNRMNDMVHGARVTRGEILVDGVNIYDPRLEVIQLRRNVGMVFQKSNPFPSSIYENVAYGLRINGVTSKRAIDEAVEESLTAAALWDETKDRLHESALGMSGGQQQRLCIARTIAVRPDIILMDEPCSALDPIATLRIEELIHGLREKFTIVIVTHNMQQATRCSDHTAFFYLGEMVEFAPTTAIFSSPKQKRTEDYISGRFG